MIELVRIVYGGPTGQRGGLAIGVSVTAISKAIDRPRRNALGLERGRQVSAQSREVQGFNGTEADVPQ